MCNQSAVCIIPTKHPNNEHLIKVMTEKLISLELFEIAPIWDKLSWNKRVISKALPKKNNNKKYTPIRWIYFSIEKNIKAS